MQLQPVSLVERHWGTSDFLILWFGASISIAEMYAGNLLVPLGWTLGLSAILLGHAIGNLPLALGGLIGQEKGLPTMVLLRPTLGRRGSYLATVLNILQLVGWTAIMLIICGRTVRALAGPGLLGSKSLWIVLAGSVCTAWALMGKWTFKWLQRLSITALGCLCIAMTVMLLLHFFSSSSEPSAADTGVMSFGTGLDLCIAMPISWLPLVADYSRFGRSRKGTFWGAYLGYFVGSSWMFALGLGSGILLDQPEPILAFATLWFGMPALIIVLFSTFTTTFLDIYSTAVSSLNLSSRGPVFPRILAAGLLGIGIAMILPMEQYESFLLLIGTFFVPLFGMVLTQYLFMEYEVKWEKEFDWLALGVWAAGIFIYQWVLRAEFVFGASLPALVVTGILFYLVKRCVPSARRPT